MNAPDGGNRVISTSAPRKIEGLRRTLWFAAGTFFLATGMVGIALPILPTTPFLLLAAACYLRSSERMYEWMLTNRIFGRHLRDYREGRGISVRVKAGTIALLWIVMAVSMAFFTDELWLRGGLLAVAIAVSAHVATVKPRSRLSGEA